ncbi:MAG: prephenate dehydrogenase [Planctomycetaceae bacterium]
MNHPDFIADPERSKPPETLAIIGVGMIGGSVAAAVKKNQLPYRILGVGRNESRLQAAQQAGLIDEFTTDQQEAARRAKLLIFCTPVDKIVAGILAVAQNCQPQTLVTDVGSIKEQIHRELAGKLPDDVTFIGSHPLAGSEKNGFEYAEPDLFQDRVCVITPDEDSPAEMLNRLSEFWQRLGMRVVEKSPEEHDQLLAVTSHLPHVLAGALAVLLNDENRLFAASGFRDTTRIAASDPDLWTAIFLANQRSVSNQITHFQQVLQEFQQAIENGNASDLKNLLERAKTNRDLLDESHSVERS